MKKHWKLERTPDGIGWLHFDHADSPVNILSTEAFEQFDSILAEIEADPLKGLIILSDKKSGFIAGADVKNFRKAQQPDQVEAHIHHVHRIFQRLEDLACPTLALIHGFCLGGGLELALACDYRIARDDEGTRLSFPEVRLGIFPGYGGSVRSVRLLGPIPAMKFMLGGRSISGRSAKRLGLVDQTAPERQLKHAAAQLITSAPPPHQPAAWTKLLNITPARQLLAPILHRATAKKVREAHYPAPFALINHWRDSGGNEQLMFASEATNLGQLITGPTAQNLIRVFFLQERLKSVAAGIDFKSRQVHVIGGGIMGGDIAAWCALKGQRVTLQDREAKFLTQAVNRAHKLFQRKLKSKRLVQAAMDRLMPDPRGYGVKHADVVIEAIYEDLEAKQTLFQDLESKVGPDTLLATNTSSIPLESISEALENPERLIGLHFFNPVAKMQLIEVVSGRETDPLLMQKGAAFSRSIDRLPLPVRSSPGFLVNRILMPYLLEAIELLGEGVPGPLIDNAATRFGMPMGPVELADRVGLDICLAVANKLAPVFNLEVPEQLHVMVDQKRLGVKTGAGFYRYEKGKAIKEDLDSQFHAPNDLADRMIFRLLNEAVACLREQVVEDEDLLDAGIIFGTGFAPFRGGPMHYIHSGGLTRMRQRLNELEQLHGDQFHPDSGWTNLSGA
ncbi:crotonase [bacterium endosymbiont of Escarpia laminata]|nr:MAG: crotonase [bacterium endosymbiont of Escarpia laminata]